MTLDDTIVLVCTAIQPHLGTDDPKEAAPHIEEAAAEVRRVFAESPEFKNAFIAAVTAIVTEARRGWVQQ